jgi:hypothetical protein
LWGTECLWNREGKRGIMKEFDYRDREVRHNIKMKLRRDIKRNKQHRSNTDKLLKYNYKTEEIKGRI